MWKMHSPESSWKNRNLLVCISRVDRPPYRRISEDVVHHSLFFSRISSERRPHRVLVGKERSGVCSRRRVMQIRCFQQRFHQILAIDSWRNRFHNTQTTLGLQTTISGANYASPCARHIPCRQRRKKSDEYTLQSCLRLAFCLAIPA